MNISIQTLNLNTTLDKCAGIVSSASHLLMCCTRGPCEEILAGIQEIHGLLMHAKLYEVNRPS